MSRFKSKVENPNTKNKGCIVRLYPTEEQATMIKKTIGSARKIYNLLLNDAKEQYEKDKTFLLLHRGYAYYKDSSHWRDGEDYSYLSEVDSQALGTAQLNLFKRIKISLLKERVSQLSSVNQIQNNHIPRSRI